MHIVLKKTKKRNIFSRLSASNLINIIKLA